MQQIERYGVIALVFLLVTIVAVSFWGDSKSPGFWSRLTGRAKKEEVAKVDPSANAPAATAERALGAPTMPIATLGAAQPAAMPAAQPDPFAQLSMQAQPGLGAQPTNAQP